MTRLLLCSTRYSRLCPICTSASVAVNQSTFFFPASSPHHNQKRLLTNKDALGILNLGNTRVTPTVLRSAYLEAAKQCHPDTLQQQQQQQNDDNDTSADKNTVTDNCKQQAAQQFRLVTQAYEVLLGNGNLASDDYDDYGISIEEDAAFRRACQERLGLDAEIVEESKQCPAFRDWLNGKTDAAHYWRVFFIQHGGLAPQLRPPVAGLLESNQELKKSSTRRRRPSQSTNL